MFSLRAFCGFTRFRSCLIHSPHCLSGCVCGKSWSANLKFKTQLVDTRLSPRTLSLLRLAHTNEHSRVVFFFSSPIRLQKQRAVPVTLCPACGGFTGCSERLTPPRWPSAFDLRPTWSRDIAQRCCGAQHFWSRASFSASLKAQTVGFSRRFSSCSATFPCGWLPCSSYTPLRQWVAAREASLTGFGRSLEVFSHSIMFKVGWPRLQKFLI